QHQQQQQYHQPQQQKQRHSEISNSKSLKFNSNTTTNTINNHNTNTTSNSSSSSKNSFKIRHRTHYVKNRQTYETRRQTHHTKNRNRDLRGERYFNTATVHEIHHSNIKIFSSTADMLRISNYNTNTTNTTTNYNTTKTTTTTTTSTNTTTNTNTTNTNTTTNTITIIHNTNTNTSDDDHKTKILYTDYETRFNPNIDTTTNKRKIKAKSHFVGEVYVLSGPYPARWSPSVMYRVDMTEFCAKKGLSLQSRFLLEHKVWSIQGRQLYNVTFNYNVVFIPQRTSGQCFEFSGRQFCSLDQY
ncbi:hypothetical protein Ahia01_000990100, partial [Argonauta hians]